jgi:hypothetical protein
MEGSLMVRALSACLVAMEEAPLKTWPEEKTWLGDYLSRRCPL